MSPAQRRGAILTAALVSLGVVLYLTIDWWALVLAPPLLLIGVLALMVNSTKAATPGETVRPPDPFVESGPKNARIKAALAPSQDREYPFVLSAMVWWRWVGEPDHRLRNPEGLARQLVVEQARRVSEGYQPEQHDMALHQVAATLGVASHGFGGAVEVWADDVTLALSEEDQTRLARIAKARKESVLWEVERSVESAKRRYYADDVLATPGSAVVWDLVRGDADVDRTHGLIEVLTRVAEASKGVDSADLLDRLRSASPESFSFLNGTGLPVRSPDSPVWEWPEGRDWADEVTVARASGGGASTSVEGALDGAVGRLMDEIEGMENEDLRIQVVDRWAKSFELASLTEIAEMIRRRYPLEPEREADGDDPPLVGLTYLAPEAVPSPNGDGVPF
ncbi:hypothetical protein [Nocardiopsis sp. NPDC058789]|uniref:hypothetical protein n=1 Tax=Nocardiopsis sp. NPDC058789 TaxID=3346634 RepID=UPI00366B6102